MPPATKEKPMVDKKPPVTESKPKPSYLPACIEEVNASIAAVWESTGTWKKLSQVVNDPTIKERMLKICNMQEMPLIGIDIIPT